MIFTVVRIEYTPKETIKIVKPHLDVEEERIENILKFMVADPATY